MVLSKIKKYWFGILLIVSILFTLFSCDIQKKAVKSKRDTTTQNDIVKESTKVTEEKREGGSIKSEIIPIQERERDENGQIKELIQTLRDGGLTKTIYYKPDGRVDVDCTADEIWTRIEEKLNERDNSVTETEVKEKEREKEENFDSSVILYFMGGIVILGLGGLFIMLYFANKHTKILNLLLQKIT